jgi:hypothetical protein
MQISLAMHRELCVGGRAYQFRNDGHRRQGASALDSNKNMAGSNYQKGVQFLVRQIYCKRLAKL